MKISVALGLLGSLAQAGLVPVATSRPEETVAVRDAKPNLPPAPDSISTCTFWWDNVDGSITCKDMPGEWGISIENFLKWNPSLTPDFTNYLNGLAYCVEAPAASPTTTSSAPSGTTSSPPGNGIETPRPTQPGMVSNCSKFYFVKTGDSCFSIAAANGISEAQFLSWNPSVGANCGGMWAAAYVCVRTLDFVSPTTATPTTTTSPTTTKTPGNGIETPQPTQPGMISNCDKFYFVKTDESCASIAASQGISVAQFLAWNPMAVSI